MVKFSHLYSDLGHQGCDKTMSLIKKRFFCPGINAFVAEQVWQCDRCTLRKANLGISAKLMTIESTAWRLFVCPRLSFVGKVQEWRSFACFFVVC